MVLSALSREEKLFLSRLEDLLIASDTQPKFSSFLTSRQLAIANAFVIQRHCGDLVHFHGGYSDAARQVMGAFPSYQQPDTALFPIQAVTVFFRKGQALSHRDFLGSLMGLLIKRESIGDIVVEDGKCTVFFLEPVVQIVMQELQKVGSTGVRCELGISGEICAIQEFDSMYGTVSSTRLDCLVSLITGLSREKSAKLILAEQVQLEHVPVLNLSKPFETGNTVVIRGFGKYVVDKIGNPTRKGRLPVDFRKYR